jgi:hypothetical protein
MGYAPTEHTTREVSMILSPRRVVRGSALLVLSFVVFAPAKAVADVPQDLGDATGQVTESAGDATDQVTETAGDATDQVTETAGDATDQVTETAGDATDQVTQTAGDATDQVTQTAGDAIGTSSSGTLGDTAAGSGTDYDASKHELTHGVDVPGGIRALNSRAEFTRGVVLTNEVTDEVGEPTDPCEEQPQLVCLGLLYGVGEFADGGAKVLAFVATTGIAVIGLIAIAVGLGTSGSTLLAMSRRLAASAEGTVAD